LEFANGRIVQVHELCPGQRASVLQLPAASVVQQPANASSAVS
jgi:hypothetical protein